MGEVWKAEDTLLGRLVALKLLPQGHTPQDRERFLRGLRAASLLQHPGIATVYEADDSEAGPFAALAFVDGSTLTDLIRGGPIALPEIVRITIEAADALAHAHANDVLHRDVKDANLMLARDQRVVIVDFGLARAANSPTLSSSGVVFGTVQYIAPEVWRDAKQTSSSDLYGLGVVMYKMLTGTLPFTADTDAGLCYRVLNELPEAPSRRSPGVPEAIERITLRLLEKDPDARHASAEALAAELRSLRLDHLTRSAELLSVPRADAMPTAGRALRLPENLYLLVLPFTEMASGTSDDDRRALMAVGLAESTSAGLAELPDLRVFPPSALDAVAGAGDPRVAASRFGANLVLGGSLRRVNEQARVTWWLLQPGTGLQVASNTLEGSSHDLFDLEDRLLADVRAALGRDEMRPARAPARDPAAHERYLQALGYLQRHENEAAVDGAIGLLERLIEADSAFAPFHATLGRAYLFKHQLTNATRWLTRAASASERAMRLEPDAPEVLLTLGAIRFATGHPEEAVTFYRGAIEGRGEDVETLVALSRALEAAGDPLGAEDVARRAIRLSPDDWRGYNRLGNLSFRQTKYLDASQAWREVTRLSPDNARGWYNLGAAYFRSDRLEDALGAYGRSLEIRPSARAFEGYGSVLFYSGRIDEAIKTFERACALLPDDPVTWGNLGSALIENPARREEARRHLERATAAMRSRTELNPRDADSLSLLGNWLVLLGELAEGRSTIQRAQALEPDNGAHMIRRAFVEALLGERESAGSWLRQALGRGYGEAAIRDHHVLGPILAEIGSEHGPIMHASEASPPVEAPSNRGGEA